MKRDILKVHIVEIKNLSILNSNGLLPKNIKIKVGNGRLGNWIKSNSVQYPVTGNIQLNWRFSLKYKNRYPILYIKISDDSFLGSHLGECKINLSSICNNNQKSTYLNLPILPINFITSNGNGNSNSIINPFQNYGEFVIKISLVHNEVDSIKSIQLSNQSSDMMQIDSDNSSYCNNTTNTNTNTNSSHKTMKKIIKSSSNRILDTFKNFIHHHHHHSHHSNNNNNNNNTELDLGTTTTTTTTSTINNNSDDSINILDSDKEITKEESNKLQLQQLIQKLKSNSSNSQSSNDKLDIIVISSTGLDYYEPRENLMVACKINVGILDIKSNTFIKPVSDLHWKQFFEISLSNPIQRYSLNTLNLVLSLVDYTSNPPITLGESKEFDLFSLERSKIIELKLPVQLSDQIYPNFNESTHPVEISVLLKYETGDLTPEESSELFFQAICAEDTILINSLLSKSININQNFRENKHQTKPSYTTPLIKAAKQGNYRAVKRILELGASPNVRDHDGFTALMKSVQYDGVYQSTSNIHLTKLLLDYGSDPNLKNRFGETIYHLSLSNWEMNTFLSSVMNDRFYKVTMVLCPSCSYIEFPTHNHSIHIKRKSHHYCSLCGQNLGIENEFVKLLSKSELISLSKRFYSKSSLSNPLVLNQHQSNCSKIQCHYMISCPLCHTFGFLSDNSLISGLYKFNQSGGTNCTSLLSHLPTCSIPQLQYTKIYLTQKQADNLIYFIIKKSKQLDINSSSSNQLDFLNQNQIGFDLLNPGSNSDTNHIFTLPKELLEIILKNLNDAKDLTTCSRVSWIFNEIIRDSMFWKNKIYSLYPTLSSRLDSLPRVLNVKKAEQLVVYQKLYHHYHDLSEWIRVLLLEESFKPRYTIQVDPLTGFMVVELTLTSTKYLFNKDGLSFNFENEFKLLLEFSDKKEIQSIRLHAFNQPAHLVAELCELIQIPSSLKISMRQVSQHQGSISLFLNLQSKALGKWIHSYLQHRIPGFHSFLMIRDDIGGSIILDFYYYNIENIILLPPIILPTHNTLITPHSTSISNFLPTMISTAS